MSLGGNIFNDFLLVILEYVKKIYIYIQSNAFYTVQFHIKYQLPLYMINLLFPPALQRSADVFIQQFRNI